MKNISGASHLDGISDPALSERASDRQFRRLKPEARIVEALLDKNKACFLNSFEIFDHALSDAKNTGENNDPSNLPHAKEAYKLMLAYCKAKFNAITRPWEGAEDSDDYKEALRNFFVFCRYYAEKKKESEQLAKEIEIIPIMDFSLKRLSGTIIMEAGKGTVHGACGQYARLL